MWICYSGGMRLDGLGAELWWKHVGLESLAVANRPGMWLLSLLSSPTLPSSTLIWVTYLAVMMADDALRGWKRQGGILNLKRLTEVRVLLCQSGIPRPFIPTGISAWCCLHHLLAHHGKKYVLWHPLWVKNAGCLRDSCFPPKDFKWKTVRGIAVHTAACNFPSFAMLQSICILKLLLHYTYFFY